MLKHSLHVYNADKTGRTDFASESLGASIMFTRCTEAYIEKSRWFTVMNVQVMPLYNTPRVIIQVGTDVSSISFKNLSTVSVLFSSRTIFIQEIVMHSKETRQIFL